VKKIRIQEKKNNLKYLKTIQVSRIQESGVRIPPLTLTLSHQGERGYD